MTRRRNKDLTRPLRVTTMVDSLAAGGAERVAVEVACGLDRSSFDPHVIVTRGDGPLVELLEDAAVPYTILGRGDTLELAPWHRAHRLLVEQSDLLHSHKFGSNAWGALLARTARVPLIAHEHNFSEHPTRSRKLIDRRWIASRASRVLCVSDSVADIERACGVPDRIIDVVANGVHTEAAWPREAARAELGLVDSSFTIGIVGGLRPEKAHEVLLAAMAELATSGRDVRLCVVGSGPRSEELQLLAASLGIAGRVTWAGERKNAATLAAAFDAGVLCSHWEGMPLAALETMAAGVPLVATSVGGLPTLLADNAGLLVPPADPAALAAALTRLMDDPTLGRRLARAGARRVHESYSFEAMVQRIETIYTDVASTGARSARESRRIKRAAARGERQEAA
ncbi:MAG: glycosyltransferase [Gaiellales bacterium]